MTTTTITRPASDKQIALIARLLNEKDVPAGIDTAPTTSRAASALIDFLFAAPRKPAPTATPAGEPVGGPGYYVRNGEMFVVVENKAGTNVYAKRLVLAAGRASWEYAPGVARTFAASEVLTATEAAAFGHLHGFCIRCCRPLSDLRSVAAGYGQTCAAKFGWSYPTKKEALAIVAEWDADRRERFAAILAAEGIAADTGHDTPCVCGTYDRCQAVRLADAKAVAHRGATAAFRAQHRAYND